MPLRAIIKPEIYSQWQFSCACPAVKISLKTLVTRFFVYLVDLGAFASKIAPAWHSLKTLFRLVLIYFGPT